MQRPLTCVPLPAWQRSKLEKAGFTTVSDLTAAGPVELSRELGISKEDAVELLQAARCESGFPSAHGREAGSHGDNPEYHSKKSSTNGMSVLELLQHEHSLVSIVTYSAAVDDMLGGGVPLGKITEFCGVPGVGKTQIGIQLSVDVQIPMAFGGLGGEAVFIDAEGSFMAVRALDMASATLCHLRELAEDAGADEDQRTAVADLSTDDFLAGIHVYSCLDFVQLLAVVNLLSDFIKCHPKVKLVVIDSIAAHFRHEFDDYAQRTRILNGLAQSLIRLANQFDLAVVLINQMTTKISKGGASSSLAPALGQSWGHACTNRVLLSWQGDVRVATLFKSPNRQEMTVPFQVTMDGIRDIPSRFAGGSSTGGIPELSATKRLLTSQSDITDVSKKKARV